MSNTPRPNSDTKIGALWKKTSANGQTYYSGELEENVLELLSGAAADGKIRIVGFANKDKNNPSQPDLRLLISAPLNPAPAPPTPAKKAAPAPAPVAKRAAPKPQQKAVVELPVDDSEGQQETAPADDDLI